ncbi:MAG TPA: restriction endonuclease subunit S [Candidatus Acidoferrales bacterium]
MSTVPTDAVTDLLKREPAKIVAATGTFFESLAERYAQRTVADILESHRGGVWGDEAGDGCGYPVLRSTNMRGSKADVADVAWREIPAKQAADCALQTGDILVAKSSGSSDLVGKSVLFVHPGNRRTYLFSNFTLRLRPNAKVIVPAFLAWFLRSPQALGWRYDTQQNTVGLRNLQTEKFLSQRLPMPPVPIQQAVTTYFDALEAGRDSSAVLPPELAEQRRIVSRIEALTAKIDQVRSLRQQSQEETASLLPSAYAKAYDEAVRIARGTETLDVLCRTITDGTHVTPRYVSEGVPFLSVKDITSGTISFDNSRFITPEEHAFLTKRCIPERDDVLLTKVGTTGFAKAIDVDREFSIFVSLALLKLKKDRLLPKFTEYMLNSSRLRELSTSGTRGVGNKNLVLKFIRNFPMPAPALPEQRRIVTYLDDVQAKVDSLKKLQSETADELDALMPSILSRAFRGEL